MPGERDKGRARMLIVTPWPLAAPGGAQRLAAGVGASLADDHGFDVFVAAGSGAPGTPPIAPLASPREIRLELVRDSRAGRGRRSLLDTTFLRGLDAVARDVRPDAILYAQHYSSSARQTAEVAARAHVPFVMLPAIHLDLRSHTNRDARRFYRSAALVVCLSDVERRWLAGRAAVAADRTLTIRFGWDPSATRPAGTIGRRAERRLLSVGAFVRHKRLDDQIEAVAILRRLVSHDVTLTLAGAVPEPAVIAGLRDLARRRRVADCVEIVPDCTDATIARLHAESDAFLFTSESESFGAALLEAIGYGTLPVVYPHPIYRTLVEESGFGTLARRATPPALARAAAAVFERPPAHSEPARLQWLSARSWREATAPLAAAWRGGYGENVRSAAPNRVQKALSRVVSGFWNSTPPRY